MSDLLQQTGTPLAAHRDCSRTFLSHCDLLEICALAAFRPRDGIDARKRPRLHRRNAARSRNPQTRPWRRRLPQPELAPSQMIHFLASPTFVAAAFAAGRRVLAGTQGPRRRGRIFQRRVAREVARETRSRAGRWLMLFPLLAAALLHRRTGPSATPAGHDRSPGQRHRHHAGDRRLRLDAVARLSRWTASRSSRVDIVKSGRLEVHRRASRRPHGPDRIFRLSLT